MRLARSAGSLRESARGSVHEACRNVREGQLSCCLVRRTSYEAEGVNIVESLLCSRGVNCSWGGA